MTKSIIPILTFLVISASLVLVGIGARSPGIGRSRGPSEERVSQLAKTDSKIGEQFSSEDVSRHNTVNDCWMIIKGKVYDVSDYLPNHPSRPGTLTNFCGKDATHAFETKEKNEEHTHYAEKLLEKYYRGRLAL